jgi:hypothetical protein
MNVGRFLKNAVAADLERQARIHDRKSGKTLWRTGNHVRKADGLAELAERLRDD